MRQIYCGNKKRDITNQPAATQTKFIMEPKINDYIAKLMKPTLIMKNQNYELNERKQTKFIIRHRSLGPELIWPNITIG